MFPFPEEVTVIRAARTVDPFSGDESDALDWSDAAEHNLSGTFAPSTTSLGMEPGSHQITTTATVYVPFDADVDPRDRIRVRGTVYAIDGAIERWRNPYSGSRSGAVVKLGQVIG